MLGLNLKDCKDKHGQFMQSFNDGSTIIYYDTDDEALCADCANKEDMSTEVKLAGIYEEGPAIECCDCHNGIESKYGNPEDDNEEGEKLTFLGLPGMDGIRIPHDSYPLRSDFFLTSGLKAVWPWDGGEYLLTYGDILVKQFFLKWEAVAFMDNLTGLCTLCGQPLWRSLGNVCIHAPVDPPFQHKELVINVAAKEQAFERLRKRQATIEYASIPYGWKRMKIGYIVFTKSERKEE